MEFVNFMNEYGSSIVIVDYTHPKHRRDPFEIAITNCMGRFCQIGHIKCKMMLRTNDPSVQEGVEELKKSFLEGLFSGRYIKWFTKRPEILFHLTKHGFEEEVLALDPIISRLPLFLGLRLRHTWEHELTTHHLLQERAMQSLLEKKRTLIQADTVEEKLIMLFS